MPETNYYNLLTISRTASTADIKMRYRKLSLKYHPDSGGSTQQMVLLNKAYSVLSNPLLRREYDQKHPAIAQAQTRTQPSSGFDFVTKPTYHAPRRTEPAVRTRRDESVWDYAPKPERRQKTRKHFWPWFAVSVIAIGFLGYQVISFLQPSSDDPATGVATTTTTSTTTTPLDQVPPDSSAATNSIDTQPTDTLADTTANSTSPTTTSITGTTHYSRHHIKYDDSL